MGCPGDHGVLGVTQPAVDLIYDPVHIDRGLRLIKEAGLVLILAHQVHKLYASLLVAVAGPVDLLEETPGHGHELRRRMSWPI